MVSFFRKVYQHSILHRHIQSVATITNESVILENYDDKGKKIVNMNISLSEISDIIVVNQRRIGTGQHQTIGIGHNIRNYYGNSNFSSQSVGDIVFIKNGIPAITFRDVNDPSGVCRLAKSARSYRMSMDTKVTDGMNAIFDHGN